MTTPPLSVTWSQSAPASYAIAPTDAFRVPDPVLVTATAWGGGLAPLASARKVRVFDAS